MNVASVLQGKLASQNTNCGYVSLNIQERQSEQDDLLVSSPPYSAIREHAHNSDHPIELDYSFSVVTWRTNRPEALITESLLIVKKRLSLVNNISSVTVFWF